MPRRKGGLFLPLDVNFWDDPRIVRAGERAAVLYQVICIKCKTTGNDGRFDPVMLPRLNVPGWQKRLPPLFEEQLLLDLDDGYYTVAAWLKHNDPQAKIEDKRAVDREYHAGRRRNRVGTDSDPSRSAERSREEKREVRTSPHGPCPGCADCPAPSLRAVGDDQ